MDTEYRTVLTPATAELTERRSRFLAILAPAPSEQQAQELIRERRRQMWDARHHVSAFCVREGTVTRCSDDGEPAGTGGIPVLETLQRESLTDCVLVVTRYFGGILLGTGGLSRAYAGAARAVVEAAEQVTMRACQTGTICCEYGQYGSLPPLIAAVGGRVLKETFGGTVVVEAAIPSAAVPRFCAALTEKSCGMLSFVPTDTQFFPFGQP